MDDLERRLTEAGQAWRDRQAEPPSVDRLLQAIERPRAPWRWRWIASATTIAAVVVIGAVILGPRLGDLRTGSDPKDAPGVLHLVNVDGPDVSVLLDGQVVVELPCGASRELATGDGRSPLPWTLEVRATDGEVIGTPTIEGPLPRGLLIRGRNVLTAPWPMKDGPAPANPNAPCGVPASPGWTPRPTEPSIAAEDADGDYRLVFELAKQVWNTDESIVGEARLEHGAAPWGVWGSGGGPIAFSISQVGGPRTTGWVSTADCVLHQAEGDQGLTTSLRKSGSWPADDPLASFYRDFFADPLYRLPPGDWEISATAIFYGADCGGDPRDLHTTLRIRVVQASDVGADEPAHAEATDGLFRLVFDAPKTTWTTEESISAAAQIQFDGIESMTLAGSGGGLIGFGAVELGGTRRLAYGGQDDCALYDMSGSQPVVSGLRKSAAWRDSDPNADFYRAWVADPLYRLSPGDWEVTAYAEFFEGECDASAPRHQLQATIVFHVVPGEAP